MKSNLLVLFPMALLFVAVTFFQGCKADKLPDPVTASFCDTISATYNASVKAIIDSKCAISSCHGGPQGPNLSTFSGVSGASDRIAARALDLQTMPPSSMPQLTNEEMDIMNCWRNDGFPEQ